MIIIQETDASVLDVLQFALESEGFEVITVQNCDHDFIGLIEKARPHMVILDFLLKGRECIDICKRIRENYPHLPVIALSCNSNIHEEYSRHGFDDYIPKPFDLDLLFTVIRKYIPQPEDQIT